LSDEAYCIGPDPAQSSYLNIEKIIKTAKKANAEAIYPGYGFLSQNADFVEQCEDDGIVFIGPPSKVHRLVGDKVNAKKCAEEVGIPVLPGSPPLNSVEETVEEADKLGYPVIVKPVSGGGGIGLRVCQNKDDIDEVFRIASQLANDVFTGHEIFLEKCVQAPRHIEVQILADSKFNIIHLGERECTVQRRFQKLVEEAPSTIVDEEIRERLGVAALKLAKRVGYVSAGTVEFLYSPIEDELYFLEVNSRIQVEHPVTEAITGIDLVKEQIKIATGESIGYDQKDIKFNGHAIECRIYAENPLDEFAPSPGTITAYAEPGGPGIRADGGVYSGYTMSPFYDPLIVKLISWGRTRSESINRAKRALNEFIVGGVYTNKSLYQAIFSDQAFIEGEFNTGFIEDRSIVKQSTRFEGTERKSVASQMPQMLVNVKVEIDGKIFTVTAVNPYISNPYLSKPVPTPLRHKGNQWSLAGRLEEMR
jgi:pyruvate carboxylase subunit A